MQSSSIDPYQIFSPAVAARVVDDPGLLTPQTRTLSLLFADLRQFTALSSQLSPRDSYHLLGEVLEALTEEVMDRDGVVIDYYGDGLCALWNAPVPTPRHAEAACDAALGMLDAMPAITRSWADCLPGALEVRIGIHTGEAQVGNAGTRRRFKYGPRGLAVHLASRVEMAAKYLDIPLLTTEATRRQLSSDYFSLRVCRAALPGFQEPHALYAVYRAADAVGLRDKLDDYARALESFEAGRLAEAERLLETLARQRQIAPAGFLSDHASALRLGRLGRRATDEVGDGPDAIIDILPK